MQNDYNWNPSTCFYENSKDLKGIANTSVITCNDIVSIIDIVSAIITNSIGTNVSINSNDKKWDIKLTVVFCMQFY